MINKINNLGVIYKLTNLLNGKSYIGQTMQSLQERLIQHRTDSRAYPIGNAIRKYGIDNFAITVLAESNRREVLDRLEEYFIIVENTQRPFGYNIKAGGNTATATDEVRAKLRRANLGKRHSEESRRKMSKSRAGHPKHWASMKGKKHTEKTRAILREQRIGVKNPFFGRKHTAETKRKISEWSSKPRKRKAVQSPHQE